MTKREKDQLFNTVNQILTESMKQIEFLIINTHTINELSNKSIALDKVNSFRDAITLVYLAGLNKGILQKVQLDLIHQLLNKGVINEMSVDSQVFAIQLKREVNKV